jgi:hypothetical protein
MKRATSIFLLFVMSLTSVQATWTLHYCGGSLRSVGLSGNIPEMACCMEAMGEESTPAASGNDREERLPAISDPFTPCCSNRMVEISTDDCQTPHAEQGSIPHPSPVTSPVPFISEYIEPVADRIIPFTFPPGSRAKYKADLLTFICIFRI